jgi:hypothetical protein
MLRREFLIGASAMALVGCTGGDTGTTIGDVIAEIKKQCAFAPDLDAIIKVVTTLVTGFNAQAGAAAVIATAVAKQIIDMVCNAVKAQLAQMSAEKKSMPSKITIVVNHVPVEGAYGSSS